MSARISRSVLALAVLMAASAANAQGVRNRPSQIPQQGEGSGVPQKMQKTFPLGQSWAALSLNNKSYPAGEGRPSFIVDQNLRMRGFGGCNTFSATAYPLKEQGFAVGPFAITKNKCSPQLMASEHAFFIALRTAQKWDVVNGQLVLTGQGGVLKSERAL